MWNAEVYDKFSKERIQPSIDLVNRIEERNFNRIIDIGCGSGMSTITLRDKFKEAEIIGVDLSEDMLEKAKQTISDVTFIRKDCSKKINDLGSFDLVFSNAFLQWINNQEEFIRNTKEIINEDGVLAFQIPSFEQMEIAEIIKNTAKEFDERNELFYDMDKSICFNYNLREYYDIFSKYYSNIEIWQTNYIHQMNSCKEIVNMMKGTALVPYLEHLNDNKILEFLNLLVKNTGEKYTNSENGYVLFEFKRIFIIASK